MVQLGKKLITFYQNETGNLFDTQCILDSLPYDVALFNQKLELVSWNARFSKQLKINKDDIEAGNLLEDLFT